MATGFDIGGRDLYMGRNKGDMNRKDCQVSYKV